MLKVSSEPLITLEKAKSVSQLELLNRNLEAIVLSVYDHLIIVDIQGKIIYVKGSLFEDVCGSLPDELVGKTIFNITEPFSFISSLLNDVLIKKEKQSVTHTLADGMKLLVTVIPILDNKGSIVNIAIGFVDLIDADEQNSRKSGLAFSLEDNITLSNETNKLKKPFVFYGKKMKEVYRQVKRVAELSASVLIVGETGVGKEVVASMIHQLGSRADKPFIKVNCAAIPENLLESELFGYKGGAFTGADPKGKIGYFESANKGIIFLDEISELPYSLQVKLLRVLQEREVTPIGGLESKKLDIQVIAATNKNLEELVKANRFREDLYYRLNVIPIQIPPLRERVEDIVALAMHFISIYNQRYKRNIHFSPDAFELLKTYVWPGNVRELEHFIERVIVTQEKEYIDAKMLNQIPPFKEASKITPSPQNTLTIKEIIPLRDALEYVEEQLLMMAVEKYKSLKLAAQALELSQPTMSRKYQKIRKRLASEAKNNNKNYRERMVLEEKLEKQLRSVASVAAASLNVEEIKDLLASTTSENPTYAKLRKRLSLIRMLENEIEWIYIFTQNEEGKIINLVTDEKLKIEPGAEYIGPPEIMDSFFAAMKGKIVVSPSYVDGYGEWKSSIAPIKDETGKVIAIVGADFSMDYIERQIGRLRKLLKL